MKSPFTNRKGEAVTREQWSALLEDDSYRVVAQTKIGDTLVSTVWIGLSGSIFETMTFPDQTTQERYATEEQAVAGHAEVVRAEELRQGSRP